MISLYVDDLLVTGSNAQQVEEFKQKMIQAFEMTDLGLMTYFLEMEIKQNKNEISARRSMQMRFQRNFRWRIANQQPL